MVDIICKQFSGKSNQKRETISRWIFGEKKEKKFTKTKMQKRRKAWNSKTKSFFPTFLSDWITQFSEKIWIKTKRREKRISKIKITKFYITNKRSVYLWNTFFSLKICKRKSDQKCILFIFYLSKKKLCL